MTVATPVASAVGLGVGLGLFLGTWALLAAAGTVSKAVPAPATRRFGSTILGLFALSAIEELIFRGLVLGEGARVVGVPAALALSSLGFAASHAYPTRLTPIAWVNLTLYGALFGIAYQIGGLPAAIAVHGAWNAAEWGFGFTVSGPSTSHLLPVPPMRREVAGTPYGPEGHAMATIVCAASVAALLATVRVPGL
jgi:membrane protease YdiL (CAAX protease family)